MYALIKDGEVTKYPYNITMLKVDNPTVSFPSQVPPEILAGYGVFHVALTPKPSVVGKAVVEQTPVFVGGVWEQRWLVRDYTQAELNSLRDSAVLTRAEFKLALLSAGYLDDVEAAYPTWPRNIQIMWDDSSTFERMHPDLLNLAQQMGYTDQQLDALFGIV